MPARQHEEGPKITTALPYPARVFPIAAILFAATLCGIYVVGIKALEYNQRVDKTSALVQHLEQMAADLYTADAAQRAYLFLGTDNYLQSYRHGLTAIGGDEALLRTDADTEALPPASVLALLNHVKEKEAALAQVFQLGQTQGVKAATMATETAEGETLSNTILSELSALKTSVMVTLSRAEHRARAANSVRAATFALSIIVNLTFLVWAGRRVSRTSRAREAAMLEMTRQKELLDTTFACIGEGVIVTDVWQRVTLINPAAAHLSGWKAEEALGQAISTVFRALHSATGKPMENPVEKALRAGFFAKPDDSPLLITKTGATLPIDVSAWVIQPPDGSLFGMVLVFRDRSEQRRAAETLARGREELEKLAQERTSQLQDMVTELQHVSYSITHDMRAPLRAMSAFAEMLMDQTSSRPSVEETQDYCRRIIRAARRLDQLIVDALHYTKVVLQEVPLQPVNLTKILSDLIEVYPHLHRDRADIEIENDLPIVVGNESYLTQCFSNLLSNAVKFVEPGVRPRIRIHAQNTEGHTRIWVEDNGIGIPLAAQKRLFGMYEKLNNKYEGTGIGLAVVRKVAERMGGTVGAESAPGQGSKFWVELSLAAWGQDLIPRRSRRSEILSR